MENPHSTFSECFIDGARIYVRIRGEDHVREFNIKYYLRFDHDSKKVGLASSDGERIIFPEAKKSFGVSGGVCLSELIFGNFPNKIIFDYIEKTQFSFEKIIQHFLEKKAFGRMGGHSLVFPNFPDMLFEVSGEFVLI